MSDVAIVQEPIEPVPPILPGPEAIAEIDAAAPQVPEAVDGETLAERALPFADVEHLGVLRRAVLDALLDADEPLTVARILAELPAGSTRNSAETAIRREHDAGRIERVAPGTYKLAPPKPPNQSKPTPPDPPAVRSDGMADQDWLAALEAWVVDPSTWNTEQFGPPPNQPNNIPQDIKLRFNDRLRKRQERRREAEVAAAKRSAADADLHAKLMAVTGGNFQPGPALDDVAPIRLAMELVPLDRILYAIRCKVDKKMFPGNAAATSWREQRLLLEIAENYCRTEIVPRLVDAWSKAGRAPAPTVPIAPPAGLMPDDADELRSRHDDEHAPAGPHVMQPDVALAMPHEAAGASEAPAAVQIAPEQENASAVSPAPDNLPPASGREAVLAAFARNRTPPSPQPAPQPRPAVRQVERPPERQAEPISRDGWEELVSGYVAGKVNWNVKRLGAPPGDPNCRAPRDVLRSFGL